MGAQIAHRGSHVLNGGGEMRLVRKPVIDARHREAPLQQRYDLRVDVALVAAHPPTTMYENHQWVRTRSGRGQPHVQHLGSGRRSIGEVTERRSRSRGISRAEPRGGGPRETTGQRRGGHRHPGDEQPARRHPAQCGSRGETWLGRIGLTGTALGRTSRWWRRVCLLHRPPANDQSSRDSQCGEPPTQVVDIRSPPVVDRSRVRGGWESNRRAAAMPHRDGLGRGGGSP
jgi:hypothetical protein